MRSVVFDSHTGAVACPSYHRDHLRAGDHLAGPCIVEQLDATVVIEPGCAGHIDPHGTIVITVEGHAGGRRHGMECNELRIVMTRDAPGRPGMPSTAFQQRLKSP